MNIRSELEDHEVNHLKKLIQETPIRVDIVEQTMKRVESGFNSVGVDRVEQTMKLVENTSSSNTRNNRTHQRNVLRRIVITVASAVAVFTLVIGARFISPTTTASIQQPPVTSTIFQFAGDLGLKIAEEKNLVTKLDRSVTLEGLTLKVPVVVFDGTRVVIGIERQTSEEKYLKEEVIENISDTDILINGESLQFYAATGHGLGYFMNPGKNENTTFVQLFDAHNQGGKALPDKFQLTLTVTVSGISEPFKFNIPVVKMTNDNLDMTPSVTRKHEMIRLTLEKVEITPITTNITTRVTLPEYMRISSSASHLGYAIYDDKGNEMRPIGGSGAYPTGSIGNIMVMDSQFEPFVTMPKSITIKTYKNIMKKGDQNQFDLDENEKEKRMYFPALEITLPIGKAE